MANGWNITENIEVIMLKLILCLKTANFCINIKNKNYGIQISTAL